MDKIKIKPKEGFRVKKPNGDFLKEDGEMVERGTYWGRRLRFGEVELCVAESPKKKEIKKKKIIKEEKEAIAPETKKEGEE